MSKEKLVKTIKNEELPISQCKKFPEGYYKIGNINIENSGDCYNIGSSCYRIEKGQIIYNHSLNRYVMNTGELTNGIVKFEDTKPVFGYFNQPLRGEEITVTLEDGRAWYMLNDEIIQGNKMYREEVSTGYYFHISKMQANRFNRLTVPRQEYKTSLPYDSKGITDKYLDIYNKNYDGKWSEAVIKYGKVLKNLSFGLEFETIKGFVPNRLLNKFGLIPLRDGSISGIEYVTVPFSSEKGLQTTIDLLPLLQERTEYDNTCSLHAHLGNVPRSKEFMLAFYKVTCALQDQIYECFPLYKKYNFKVKNKNYSKPYPIFSLLSQMDPIINSNNIDENFNILYSYLSGGQSFGEVGMNLDNVKGHPSDPNGTQKWNIKTRYYLHNMIPLLFGNKTTVEFRIHTPTYDVNKIIPFILISSIIVNFTIDNEKKILEQKGFLAYKDLYSIIGEYLNSLKLSDNGMLYDSLTGYLEHRKQVTESQNQKGNIKGDESCIKGCNYIDWSKEKLNSYDMKIPVYKPLSGKQQWVDVSLNPFANKLVRKNTDDDYVYAIREKEQQYEQARITATQYLSGRDNLLKARESYYKQRGLLIPEIQW